MADNQYPFFIVGCERSGTTLLQTTLDAHPRLTIPPESHIFPRYAKTFSAYGDINKDRNLKRFVGDLLSDHWIRRWQISVTMEEFCSSLKTRTVAACLNQLFERFAQMEGKARWGEKTPEHVQYIREIKRLFPSAKFIHIVRDGRDVAQSMQKLWFGPTSIYSLAKRWKKRVTAFQEAKKYLDGSDYLEVRYEDLVCEPQKEADRIFHFLGEEPVSVSDRTEKGSRVQQYLQRGTHHQALDKPISPRKVGVYRDIFNFRELEIFETTAGALLKHYHYPLQTPAQARISQMEWIKFFLQDHFFRFFRKLRHFYFLKSEWQRLFRSLKRSLLSGFAGEQDIKGEGDPRVGRR